MPFDEQTHQKMARQGRDPRDLDGDGTVSPAEAEAYLRDFMQQASPEEQRDAMQEYLRGLSPQQRTELLRGLEQNPQTPVQPGQVRADDQGNLADALRQSLGPLLQGGGLGGLLGGLLGGQGQSAGGAARPGQSQPAEPFGQDRMAHGEQPFTDPYRGNDTPRGADMGQPGVPVGQERSPLQQAFEKDGALGSPMVQAGLVGLAGIIGSRMLRRR